MGSRSIQRVFAVLFAALLFAANAQAETIRITSGTIAAVLDPGLPSPPFELIGDRSGFRLFGDLGIDVPRFLPQCESSGGFDCVAGEAAPLVHTWGPSDDFWSPSATYKGVTFTDMTAINSRAFAFLGFTNIVVLPEFDSLSTVVLTQPLHFDILSFKASLPNNEAVDASLVGSGTLTTTWKRTEREGPRWQLLLARYDFFAPTPVPEPSTLILLGAAGTTAAARRRRRQA
jgi:hypothetical protein